MKKTAKEKTTASPATVVQLGKWTYHGPHGSFENKIQPASLGGFRWSPDGKRFAILDSRIWVFQDSGKGFKYAWNVDAESTGPAEDQKLATRPSDAAFAAGGETLFVAQHGVNDQHDRAGVRQIAVETGAEVASFRLPGDYPERISVHPGGKLLGIVSGQYGTRPPETFLATLDGKKIPLGGRGSSIAFSPGGDRVAAVCDGDARVFDLVGNEVGSVASAEDIAGWLPDGRVVIDGCVLFDPGTGKEERFSRPDIAGRLKNFFVDPSGRYIGAAYAYPGRVVCWDLRGKVVRELPILPGKSETAAMVASDGRILVGDNWQSKVHVYPAT